jgi:hypothetical protein
MSYNFNTNPYYDDFDENKGYQRVLFKPGFAVQARELTQLQTAIQSQIEKFGQHFFKDGSIVLGGLFNIDTNIDYVKITNDLDSLKSSIGDLEGKFVLGQTTGIRAYVYKVAYRAEWNYSFDVLMVRYVSAAGAVDSSTVFADGEELLIEDTTSTITATSTSATGKGSIFEIEEGIAFTSGFFSKFSKQSIILDPLDQEPDCKVGFDAVESITTSSQDTSLLDPALGSYNYSAPGADRLKISPQLIRLELDDTTTAPEFYSLFIIENGVISQVKERTQYSRILDEFAKRTYDESGNYVVRGFQIRTREHRDTGENEGLLTTGNPNLIAVGVEPGTAYVFGYEVNKDKTEYITTPKSTTSVNVNSEIISLESGNYITANQVVGSVILDDAVTVNLYNHPERRIANNTLSTTTPVGDVVGTAKVKSVVRSGSNYLIYLFDVSMSGSNSFTSNVKSLGTSSFFADVVLTGNNAVLQNGNESTLIYRLGSDFTKTNRSSDGSIDTTFSFFRTEDGVTVGTNGTFTVTVSPSPETHSYGVGSLSTSDKSGIILSLNSSANISLPGTVFVNVSTSSTTVIGSGTSFTRLNVGDRIYVGSANVPRYVSSIVSDTQLTVTSAFTSNIGIDNNLVVANSALKSYLVGDIIDLTGKGVAAGETRTVTGTTTTQLSFDLKETYSSTLSANVSFSATRNTAREIAKTLRPSRYVKVNCTTLSSKTGAISLGFSDVFQIRQIRKDSSEFTTNTQGTLVTSSFVFDSGQKDDMYDTAKIIPRVPLANGEHLLVELDYFYPDFSLGAGYFSIDSYPIDDANASTTTIFTHEIPVYTSVTTGSTYELRNCLDFRPVKERTANDTTSISDATTNPASSNTFIFKDTNGLRIPKPDSDLITDYQYYLARNDMVICGTDGVVTIVQGVPDINPYFPTTPENSMVLASLSIPPYPSLSYTYARILGKESSGVLARTLSNRRYTMKDINVLQQRIDNLEYYNAVNLLEKSASDLLILDENGLDRFKNGFFVDGFLDHSLGATTNPDYDIAVDNKEGVIRPHFELDAFEYSNNVISLTNAVKRGPLIVLPYTEKVLVSQNRVTTTRNVELSSYRYIGRITLTPPQDVWVDTTLVDKTFNLDNSPLPPVTITTSWDSWSTHITGTSTYNVYTRGKGNRNEKTSGLTSLGTFNDYASAQTAAGSRLRTKLETLTTSTETSTRTGVETTVTTVQQTQEIGSFITDVSVIPYIRPQNIKIFAQGLKANTRYYTYFDNENMSSYITPVYEQSSLPRGVTNTSPSEGDPLYSDADGRLTANLRLPAGNAKRFRTGSREVTLTDNPTNSVDASSYAKAFFFASGLNATSQRTFVSTRNAVVTQREVSETQTVVLPSTRTVEIFGPSCSAYSFKVEAPPGVPGVFVTSADVFIESKDPKLGIWFEIREMSPDGGITRTQVPFSEVWYKSSEVVTTSNAAVAHTVTFPAPVYLLNDTQYAFVIHTEGLNPNYYLWVSNVGQTDVITRTPVTGRALTGTFFTTNNNLNWIPVDGVDLKFVLRRASFSNNVIGQAVVGNKGYEFFTVANNSIGEYTNYGETIQGSSFLTLTNVVGSNTIVVTDRISGPNGFSNVVSISGSTYYTNGFNLEANDSISIFSSTGVSKSITATVATITYPTAKLKQYYASNSEIQLADSTGNFFANGSIRGLTSNNVSTVTSINEWRYSTVQIKPRNLLIPNTTCTFGFKGIKTSTGTLDSSFTTLPADETIEFENEYTIKSRSTEVSSYSGANSTQLSASFTSENEYVSPVVFDLDGSNIIAVRNIVNSNTTGETNPSGGNLLNRYISKTVTLADGQDAEDLIVYLSAYIPPTTDVKVWVKVRNANDPQGFDEKQYIELERENTTAVSSLSDKNNFIELKFKFPVSYMTGGDYGSFEYTSNGSTFGGFKQFAVKVGLLATNSSVIPRVTDLKAIALQM